MEYFQAVTSAPALPNADLDLAARDRAREADRQKKAEIERFLAEATMAGGGIIDPTDPATGEEIPEGYTETRLPGVVVEDQYAEALGFTPEEGDK